MEHRSRRLGRPRVPAVAALVAALAAASGAGAAPPSNDRFSNAELLTGERGEMRASNVGATREPGEPPHLGEPAAHSVWFRWTAPVAGSFVLDTCDSSFDTVLAVYVGTTLPTLNAVAQADDECDAQSALTIAVAAGESYLIAVDGYDGETGSIVLRWSRLSPPPNDAFASAAVLEGTSGEREGTVAGASREPGEPSDVGRLTGSVWFVWTPPSDGFTSIAVATTSFGSSIAVYVGDAPSRLQLVRANEDRDQASSAVSFQARGGARYSVAVRGAAPVLGGRFTLRWSRPQPPENDRPDQARFVSGEAGTTAATTFAAGIEGPEQPATGLGEEAGSVWLAWRAPRDGAASVQVCGSGMRGVAVLAGETGTPVGSRTGACGGARVGFVAAAGVVYRVAVVGPRERSVASTVSWGYPPANDDFGRAHDLGDAPAGAVAGSTAGATVEPDEPLPSNARTIASTWYVWRAPMTGWTTFDTCGSAFDTVVAVHSGDELRSLAQLAVDDDSCRSGTSRVRLRVEQGVVYRIAVRGFESDTGEFELHWRPSPPPLNDAFARAAVLRGASGSTDGTTIGTGRERGEPAPARRTTGSAWYRWVAPATRWVSFATCGSGFDTVVAVYRSGRLARLTPLDVGDDECDAGSIVRFAAAQGVEYRIVVTGYARQDDFTLSWEPIAAPPCVVPTVVGRPVPEARAMIEDAYCRVGAIRIVRLDLVRRGTVVGQTPQDAGRPVRRPNGTRVRLEVAGS